MIGRCCMQFSNSAGKFACGAQFCIHAKNMAVFCSHHISGGQISTFIPSIQIFDFYPIGRLPHLHFFFQGRIEGQRLLPSIFCKVGVDGSMFFNLDSV